MVVVHHRTPEVLRDCLTRVISAAPDASLTVVDTSPDESQGAATAVATATLREFPNVAWLPTVNHSYSHAVNAGAAASTEPLLALMNADVLVEDDTFDRLSKALVHDPATAATGPVAVNLRRRPQDLGPAYRLHYWRAARANSRNDKAGVVVPWLSGCLLLVRRSAFEEVGGFDRSLRFTNEDLDFCLKLRRRGHFLRLIDARVVHLGGSATPSHPAFMAEGRRGGYLISRRYQPAAVQSLHRAYLWLEARLGQRFGRTPAARQASAMVEAMVRTGEWDESPFGATLDDR